MNIKDYENYFRSVFSVADKKGYEEPLMPSKKINFGGEINAIYITKVIYNKPYTITLWSDGTKTMSKCDSDDEYNPASGLAFCILKKVRGKEWVRNTLKDWLPDDTHNVVDLKYIRYKNKVNKNER